MRAWIGGAVLLVAGLLGGAAWVLGALRAREPFMESPRLSLPEAEPFSADLASRLVPLADGHRFVNRLALESSPYLLQHAHNPVDWYPWGPAAFDAARRRDVPVLLSVGYATCHWCHVMERESFEDAEVAAVLNRHFVAIKVDREERPDVDGVYMTAVQLLSGGGGWPMTVFMTPEGEPFFAGTYLPARAGDRGAKMGLFELAGRVADAWSEDREALLRDAERLTTAVRQANQPKPPENMPGPAALGEAVRFLASRWDVVHGGLRGAPKFPQPSMYQLLLRYAHRARDQDALRMVVQGLEKMAAGGVYDHVGGGFHRYSTDAAWLVPHFEKMLYDNGQLASVMASALQIAPTPDIEATLRETLDYVLREMRAPEGGFYSATDADSEGVEGKYFVWTVDELRSLLGEDASAFERLYGVNETGTFEGAHILHRPEPWEAVARSLGTDVQRLRRLSVRTRATLRAARDDRVPPLLDDKILGEWNALMIVGLARGGFVLNEPRYGEAAVRAGECLHRLLRTRDGNLLRSWREGRVGGQPVLEDWAYRLSAYLDLFELTTDRRWLERAIALRDGMVERFWDDAGGGFFGTDATAETLLARDKPGYDGAQPSGNSEAAVALLRLAAWTGDERSRELAERTLLAFGSLLENGAIQNPRMACALDFRLDRPKEVAIVLTADDDGGALVDVLRSTYAPNAVRVVGSEATLGELIDLVPWVEGKQAIGGRATAYVCIEGTCKLPTSEPEALRAQLAPEVPLEGPQLRFRGR